MKSIHTYTRTNIHISGSPREREREREKEKEVSGCCLSQRYVPTVAVGGHLFDIFFLAHMGYVSTGVFFFFVLSWSSLPKDLISCLLSDLFRLFSYAWREKFISVITSPDISTLWRTRDRLRLQRSSSRWLEELNGEASWRSAYQQVLFFVLSWSSLPKDLISCLLSDLFR